MIYKQKKLIQLYSLLTGESKFQRISFFWDSLVGGI